MSRPLDRTSLNWPRAGPRKRTQSPLLLFLLLLVGDPRWPAARDWRTCSPTRLSQFDRSFETSPRQIGEEDHLCNLEKTRSSSKMWEPPPSVIDVAWGKLLPPQAHPKRGSGNHGCCAALSSTWTRRGGSSRTSRAGPRPARAGPGAAKLAANPPQARNRDTEDMVHIGTASTPKTSARPEPRALRAARKRVTRKRARAPPGCVLLARAAPDVRRWPCPR